MIYTTKLIKIGNSAGVIIPQIILDSLGWKVGDTIDIQVKNHSLIVKKVEDKKLVKSEVK